jgi:hypothetical protein
MRKFMEDPPFRQEQHRLFTVGDSYNGNNRETLHDFSRFGHRTAARFA